MDIETGDYIRVSNPKGEDAYLFKDEEGKVVKKDKGKIVVDIGEDINYYFSVHELEKVKERC